MTNAYEWAPPGMREILRTTVSATSADERIIGLLVAGSAATGTMDEFSDLDLVVVCRDADHADVLTAGPEFAARLGPLVASFTGDHVGEPRLLINLYGPPLLHVDLKFVSDRQLDDRVENGLVVWQRGDAVTAALARDPSAVAGTGPAVDRGPVLDVAALWRGQGGPRRAVRVPGRPGGSARCGARAAHRARPRASPERSTPPRDHRAGPCAGPDSDRRHRRPGRLSPRPPGRRRPVPAPAGAPPRPTTTCGGRDRGRAVRR